MVYSIDITRANERGKVDEIHAKRVSYGNVAEPTRWDEDTSLPA